MENFSNLDLMTIGIMLFLGIYCIYTYFQTRGATKLPEKSSILLPPNSAPSQCKDPQGYMQAIAPKILILGIFITLISIVEALCKVVGYQPTWLKVVLIVIPVAGLVWYTIEYKKLVAQYWAQK